MSKADESFRTLLVHDGELGFAKSQLRDLGADFEERVGATTHEDRHTPWNLVVANTTRIRELPTASSARGCVRIVILSEDSRTLRAMLRRLGVTLMVRQPVHPAAFRLLMLHGLYRGPERRRASRASVGGAVQVRLGVRGHAGILLDLSKTGCRVLLDAQPASGKRIRVLIPSELTRGKKLGVRGTTVRSEPFELEGLSGHAVGIVFDALKAPLRARLHSVLEQHVGGPAVNAGGEVADRINAPSPSLIAPARPRRQRKPALERVKEMRARQAAEVEGSAAEREQRPQRMAEAARPVEIEHRPHEAPPSEAELGTRSHPFVGSDEEHRPHEAPPCEAELGTRSHPVVGSDEERRPHEAPSSEAVLGTRSHPFVGSDDERRPKEAPPSEEKLGTRSHPLVGSDEDRRRAERRSFERRVIVLSDEAARVLLGRDLSAGGMRVDADADLVVGDRLRIALHVRSGEVPLVVEAKVIRDDGEGGLSLRFQHLSDADRNYLEKMVQGLPVLSGDDDSEDAGVVVTEILDRN